MTQIKICGITSLADANAAVEAGADLLGFNFYPPSPRSISPEECSKITSVLTRQFPTVTLVGVFVNMQMEEIKSIMEQCPLTYAQLHGDETPEMLAQLKTKAYKAFRGFPPDELFNEFMLTSAGTIPAFLMDASVKGLYGGSGITADWQDAKSLSAKYPMLLAGGLNPENVEAAIGEVRPWGVDTASGVESSPGIKTGKKMRAFVEAVRRADHLSSQLNNNPT